MRPKNKAESEAIILSLNNNRGSYLLVRDNIISPRNFTQDLLSY